MNATTQNKLFLNILEKLYNSKSKKYIMLIISIFSQVTSTGLNCVVDKMTCQTPHIQGGNNYTFQN